MCKMKSTSKKKSLNLFNHSWSGFRCLMEVILSYHTNYPFLSSPPHRTFSISRKESEVVLFGLSFKIKCNISRIKCNISRLNASSNSSFYMKEEKIGIQ